MGAGAVPIVSRPRRRGLPGLPGRPYRPSEFGAPR